MRTGRRAALALLGTLLPLLVAVPAAGSAAAEPGGRAPAATSTASYVDTCRDAGGSPFDLRSLAVSDDGAGSYALTVTSCTPWTADDVDQEALDVAVTTSGRGVGHYALVLRRSAAGSGLELVVFRERQSGGFEATHGPVPVARPDAWTARAAFPRSALDGATDFLFAASALDARGREDLLPEGYADPLEYPFSCTTTVERAATVVVERGATDRLARQAVGQGLQVEAARNQVLELDDVSDAALEQLRRTPGVRTAHRPVVFTRLRTPDDRLLPQQWSLVDPAAGIRAERGWDVRTGSGGLLAVIDDGIDGVRGELAGRVVDGLDTVHGVALPAGADSDLGGHGTSVSGLAAANTNNREGVAGVDWTARLVPYRVFDAAGCATDADVVEALYAAADRGVSVANLSLGGPGDSPSLRQAVADVSARGMLVVAASGNARQVAPDERSYPAAYDETLAVAASRRDREIARYSSGGPHVDVAAPGGAATTASFEQELLVLGERGGVEAQAGTSFAAPLVSGAAMLFRAEHPDLSPAQVITAVRRAAADAGPPGPDPDFGAGILDLDALLRIKIARPRGTGGACPPGQVPPAGFSDVPDDQVHRATIDCVAWWGVSNGRDGGYQPLEDVTREQMAAFLARVIERTGGSLPPDPPDAFDDDASSVHAGRINQLAAAGVLTGRGERRFAPLEVVTRGQMATFLMRAYELRTGTDVVADGDYFGEDAGTTHERATNEAAMLGFTGGQADGTYAPAGAVRRDAMASFLSRVLDRLVADGLTAPPGR